jgi:hypothetical protein
MNVLLRGLVFAALVIITSASLLSIAPVNAADLSQFSLRNPHGPQGTGNFKGKKDRHQKPGPENEKKKKSKNWIKK